MYLTHTDYYISVVREDGDFVPIIMIRAKVLDTRRNRFSYVDFETFSKYKIMDKLRYLRISNRYTKKEVAKATSIGITLIKSYENDRRDVYDFDHLKTLCEFYGVSIDDVCDDYNFFLQTDQAEFVRNFRKANKLTQRELGEMFDADRGLVMRYETKGCRVKKADFEVMKSIIAYINNNDSRPIDNLWKELGL